MMLDGGGSSSAYSLYTQREIMAVIGSLDSTALDRTERMWRDTASAAREIHGLVRKRLDDLTGPGGWTGPGAEAYRNSIKRDVLDKLEAYAADATRNADALAPVNQSVSSSIGAALLNDIPWDRDTNWEVTRKEVEQSLFGKVDEIFTGEDEDYEKAKEQAPYLVLNGQRNTLDSVEPKRWETLLTVYPQQQQSPQIFRQTDTPVTPQVHRFDQLMEALGLNSNQVQTVRTRADSVDEQLQRYQPTDQQHPDDDRRTRAPGSGTNDPTPNSTGTGPSAPSTNTAPPSTNNLNPSGPGGPNELGPGKPGGPSLPGGPGGPSGPGGPGGPGGPNGPGQPGGPFPGGTHPGTPGGPGFPGGPELPGGPGGSGFPGGDPGDLGIGGPGGLPGGGAPGGGGSGLDPAELSNNLPGTESAGLLTAPGSAAGMSNLGGPGVPGLGTPGAGGVGGPAINVGSGVVPTMGMGPGGLGSGGLGNSGLGGTGNGLGRGGAGGPGAGGNPLAGRSGNSFGIGPNGKGIVNPGSVGPVAGPGGAAGGPGGGAPGAGTAPGGMPMGGRRNDRKDEEKDENPYNSWLEEDEDVWFDDPDGRSR
ncbi:hypothetical protein CGZ97_15600 [Enemella evansiae]|nr:hypothetical protein CGZ97_15600 [Enemella evansiae]